MHITRRFTQPGTDVFSTVEWTKRRSRITNADGSVVFEMNDAEVPKQWSQLATDIMVSKYFRKAGVPLDGGGPALRAGAEGGGSESRTTNSSQTGPEKSARQVIHRLAGCWRHWGESHGYFDTPEDAQAFYDELCYMMLHQMGAPNSPQWFNTGLHWAYGINGPAQGHWVTDPNTGEARLADDAYTHPQPHACFIQSIRDDLVNDGGIMDLWTREARLFKYGSGTGTNFSALRGEGENLSGGGKSSGLMSFLKIGDRAAGAIKSGGTTRRAAKMVCLDADHPDIESFVNWKVREELKVAAMVEGLKHLTDDQRELAESLGLKLNYDFNGEAYYTVSGQNSNNSVRLTDDFFKAVSSDGEWKLINRTNGEVAKTIKARDLWHQICRAAWRCADPGVQFDSTINAWHTCPNDGRINASNPCVTGDTLVATSTGFRRIIDLVGRCAEVIAGDGRARFVDRIFKTGRKPVYELKTRSGYSIKVTADHLIRTLNRGDVAASDMTVDDMLKLERPGFGDDFVPEALGELVGAAVGDGCITSAPGQDFLFISLGSGEREVANRLQANINECKQWLHTGDDRGVRETVPTETATGVRVGSSVRALISKVRDLAIVDSGAAEKRLTDAVFSLDRRSQAAILRGLFTADGTVANYGAKSQYVALDSTSLELIRQVQLLLLGFGIKAKIYENRRALNQRTALLPDGKGGVKEYPVQQVHSLRISRSSRVVFEDVIGFMDESHKSRQLRELNESIAAYEDRLEDRVAGLTPLGEEDVFDLTEPDSNHFVANGIVVHNCSEYMFLDDTACNLASVNLLKFYDAETRQFDLESYEHAIELWTVVLEISVLMASFPSREIADRSWQYRTLGLGYANLGALLMQAGVPYDSDEGRAVCGMLTAVLTGRSYATSAALAKEHGPFSGYANNREPMLRVIRNHRRAAHGVARESGGYEGLEIPPVPIDGAQVDSKRMTIANADDLLSRCRAAWDDAMQLGQQYGYRNAQVSVIAPTGTIGLLMDCDTTGVEPDFALTKFKKLAGGGYFKIANQSLKPALRALGYTAQQIEDIITYVMGTLSLHTPMPEESGYKGKSFRDFLMDKGFEEDDLQEVEDQLPAVFELGFAFSAWSIPDRIMELHGVDPEEARANPSFNGLKVLGLKDAAIRELNETICGTQTIEGAPHLRDEHLPVFDCANKCGKTGQRFIAPEGHIRMMAASQPFISGAISKTINLPREATEEDIGDCYRLSWELGLKANALYRDGCKLSQPLSTKSDTDDADEDEDAVEHALGEVSTEVAELASAISTSSTSSDPPPPHAPHAHAQGDEGAGEHGQDESAPVERIVERIIERPMRRRLPETRQSVTHRFNVAGHEGYLTVGLYSDGRPGELFITMSKEGSTIGGLMDSLGTAISVALQYGVPVESLVTKFAHQRFEPMGMTGNRDIPFAKSLVDYIFRWLGMEFVPGFREQNAPRRNQPVAAERTSSGDTDDRSATTSAPRRVAADVKEDDAWLRKADQSTAAPANGGTSVAGTSVAGASRGGAVNRMKSSNGDAPAKTGGPFVESKPRHDTGDGSAMTMSARSTRVQVVERIGGASASMSAESFSVTASTSPLDQNNASLMGDAPACDVCGAITVRNGACYRCENCGNSLGCS